MGTNPRHPSPPPAAPRVDPVRLEALLDEALESLEGLVGEGLPHDYRARLAVLRALVQVPGALLAPRLDARATLGHSIPELDRLLGVEAGQGLTVLEELAELGLLERELANLVHACPSCGHGHLNFRECCTGCGGFDLGIERMVHHFRCAYQGLESEFTKGPDLVCPKCNRGLHQLGQDFERPHEAYQCNRCSEVFEEPNLEAQCMHCERTFPAGDARVERIHSYRATALAARAVELNRLTDLDLAQMLFDSELRLDSREFLVLEAKREVYRLQRHKVPFSAAILLFELDGQPYPIYRDWDRHATAKLGELLSSTRFPLDMMARVGASYLGLLLPHTDTAGRKAVAERYLKILRGLHLASVDGRELEPLWVGRTWTSPTTTAEDVLDFFQGGEQSVYQEEDEDFLPDEEPGA